MQQYRGRDSLFHHPGPLSLYCLNLVVTKTIKSGLHKRVLVAYRCTSEAPVSLVNLHCEMPFVQIRLDSLKLVAGVGFEPTTFWL